MLDNLLIHSQTKQQLQSFVENGMHALLFSGPHGGGKSHIAHVFAAELLKIEPKKLLGSAFFIVISSDDSIGIDQVRELQKRLRLKVPGHEKIKRVVVIEDAEKLTLEAQNAILKILEEPPEDTILILTESGEQGLKDTIYSRLQILHVLQPSHAQVMEHFIAQGFDGKEVESAYQLSNGQVGLVHSLLSKDSSGVLPEQVTLAKEILKSNYYERLLKIDELSKQKEQLPSLLFALRQVCRAALRGSIVADNPKMSKLWLRRLEVLFDTEKALTYSPNPKLLVTNLLANL